MNFILDANIGREKTYMRLNISNRYMPFYLSESMLETIAESICTTSDLPIFRLPRIPTVNVEFSNKIKRDVYGHITMNGAKKQLQRLCPSEGDAKAQFEDLLATINTREDIRDKAEDLAYIPTRFGGSEKYDGREIFEKIRKLADAVKFQTLRLGEYRPKEHTIVLYFASIERSCGRQKTISQAFEEVFVHELFHAYHFCWAQADPDGDDFALRTDATRDVVLESLASYFENMYCKRNDIPTDIEDVWQQNEPSIYPYAGAKYIQNDAHFENIVNCSSDLDEALREILFYDYDNGGREQFYHIKNGDIFKKYRI